MTGLTLAACAESHDHIDRIPADGAADDSEAGCDEGRCDGTQVGSLWREYEELAPPPEFRGHPTADDLAECGDVAGFLRCDRCPDRCPGGTTCVEGLGVCRARHPSGNDDGCHFMLTDDAPRAARELPFTGLPCAAAATSAPGPDGVFRGLGMPAEYCMAAAAAEGLPPQRCIYPDGSDVVTGPPAIQCSGHQELMRVCGGACGEARCFGTVGESGSLHVSRCVGLSDERSFGICSFRRLRCSPNNAPQLLSECENAHSAWWSGFEPCACLVSRSQPGAVPGPLGFVAPAGACSKYQALFPGSVECRDAHWNLVP